MWNIEIYIFRSRFSYPYCENHWGPTLVLNHPSPEYHLLCSTEEINSYRFGTAWEWVNNNRIVIFGSTVPLNNWITWINLLFLTSFVISHLNVIMKSKANPQWSVSFFWSSIKILLKDCSECFVTKAIRWVEYGGRERDSGWAENVMGPLPCKQTHTHKHALIHRCNLPQAHNFIGPTGIILCLSEVLTNSYCSAFTIGQRQWQGQKDMKNRGTAETNESKLEKSTLIWKHKKIYTGEWKQMKHTNK